MDNESSKENRLAFTLTKTHYAVKGYLDALLKSSGSDLTPPEAYLLGFIADADQGSGVPFGELRKAAKASKGTISECLSSLIRKGMVESIADPEDRRRKNFAILPRGESAVRQDRARFDRANAELACGISESDMETFFRVAEKVRKNALEEGK